MKVVIFFLFFLSILAIDAAEYDLKKTLIDQLPPNQWIQIHEQKKNDSVRFRRQNHGGCCFDTKRGRLILFGSNTHSKDWKNCLYFFDPVKREWTRSYSPDPKETYKVENGIPVAGAQADHPWATHTFGTVVYDSRRDEVVVACYPGHMRPDKWGKAVKHPWPPIEKHHTWVYRMAEKKWVPLPCDPVHFFPNSAAYDPDTSAVYGHKPGRIYGLSGTPRKWQLLAKGATVPGWGHDNCVYDAGQKKVVIFGSNKNTNHVAVFDPEKKQITQPKTAGVRPPADQHNPMAYAANVGKTVVLADRTKRKDNAEKDTTETWLYDLAKDQWTRIPTADLPFACGMNFNMAYDPSRKILLLVTGNSRRSTTVWALRIRLEEEKSE